VYKEAFQEMDILLNHLNYDKIKIFMQLIRNSVRTVVRKHIQLYSSYR